MLRDALQTRLHEAVRERDRPAMEVLRTALGAVDNASAVPDDDRTQTERWHAASTAADVARKELTEDEVQAVVRAERDSLEAAAAEYRQVDAASMADHQASILIGVLGAG